MGVTDKLTYILRNLQVKKQQLEPDMEQWTGSKLGKGYNKAVFCHSASVSQFSCSVMPDSATPQTAARQASLSITKTKSLLKFMSMELVMHPTMSSSAIPLSPCLQSLPTSGSFPMNQFFPSSGHSIGVSASASPFLI